MKITIVSGSHRGRSQSEKVGRFIEKLLREQHPDVDPYLYSLANNPLPLWEESIWESDPVWGERLAPMKERLAQSDALVVISPEWHGSVPAGLKNFFLLFGKQELGHKPALIVTVSSSTGGAYPVAELRMSSYKNNRICYIPENLVIRDVEKVLNDQPGDNDPDADTYYRERAAWTLELLIAYAMALKSLRENTRIHHPKFSNGM